MNIIIFGASGFLGRNLLPLLLEDVQIKKILAVTHKSRLNLPDMTEKVDVVSQDDFFSLRFNRNEFSDSTVICLAGNYSPKASAAGLRMANFEMPKKIIDFLKIYGIKHFILAGTINVRLPAGNGYTHYKREIEAYTASSGIPHTIFRPSLLFGKGDSVFSKIISYIKKWHIIPVLGDGNKLEQPIHVSEAAVFFYQAAVSAPANQIFEIGGLNPMSYNDMLFAIAEVFNRNIRLLHLPARPAYRILEFLERMGLRLPVNSEQILHIDNDLDIDNGPALNRYHVRLQPFKEWLREYF
jgi:NADH dehydrogenase